MSWLRSPYLFPPLILYQWCRTNFHNTGESDHLRALWADAEFLIFNKLRSGVHPQKLEKLIRKQLRLPLKSYYRQRYLLHSLRILRNICNDAMLADLPTLQEYQALARDPLFLAKFEIDMNGLFWPYESVQQKARDEFIGSKLAEHPELDLEAQQLLKSAREAANAELREARKVNVLKIYLAPEWSWKKTHYAELAESWGQTTATSRATAGPSYQVKHSTQPDAISDMFKTPPARRLRPVTEKEGNAASQPAPSPSIISNRPVSCYFLGKDDNPFYEENGNLDSIPRGEDLEVYLGNFCFAPPPLLPKGGVLPQRPISPSDFGKVLI